MTVNFKYILLFRGTFKFSEIIDAATQKGKQTIKDIQNKLQFDDPISIQFTSVGFFHIQFNSI